MKIKEKEIKKYLFIKNPNRLKMEPSSPEINLNYYNPFYWHPIFKSVTFKTRIIPTNLRFFQYLSADGIYIHPKYRNSQPKGSLDIDQIEEIESKIPTNEAVSNKNNEDFSSNQELMPEELAIFEEFDQLIINALEEFENKCFVKLNWKAARDIETWIPKQMCQNIEDVFMSLKSSAIIGEMLENCFPKTEDLKNEKDLDNAGGLYLIIKKWYDLNKALEFRCFVRKNILIAASQRYTKNCYVFLKDETFQKTLIEKIDLFFKENLHGKFPDMNFVFDAYVEIRENKSYRVWLVDINPWGTFTNSLLFSWEELDKKQESIELKVIMDDNTMVIEKNSALFQMPVEFQGEATAENIKQWIDMLSENKNVIE